MTTVSVEEFRKHIDQYLAETTNGDVVLTRGGEPWLVLRALEDDEDRMSAAFAASPEFRQMIHERRKEQGIPWAEAKKDLDLK